MGLVLYRNTDLLKFEIGEIVCYFSPLSLADKQQLLAKASKLSNSDNQAIEALEFSKEVVKKTLKKIEGVELTDGTPFVLQLENNQLTDNSLEDVMYLPVLNELLSVGANLMNSVPNDEEVKDVHGNVLKGVRYLKKI